MKLAIVHIEIVDGLQSISFICEWRLCKTRAGLECFDTINAWKSEQS